MDFFLIQKIYLNETDILVKDLHFMTFTYALTDYLNKKYNNVIRHNLLKNLRLTVNTTVLTNSKNKKLCKYNISYKSLEPLSSYAEIIYTHYIIHKNYIYILYI